MATTMQPAPLSETADAIIEEVQNLQELAQQEKVRVKE